VTSGVTRNPRPWESWERWERWSGKWGGGLGMVRPDPSLSYRLAHGGIACNFLQTICLDWKTIC
jgi:hypothetical protein